MARILIVDDDNAVQVTIRLLLERAGHSVVTAGDGRKGLGLIEREDFDLLFLDIFMGVEFSSSHGYMTTFRDVLPTLAIIIITMAAGFAALMFVRA